MLNAIGATSYPNPIGSAASAGGLEAQLSKYQGQLADWTHCSSCNTPEGKEKISAISNKIGEIKQSIKSAEEAKQRSSQAINATVIFPTIDIKGTFAKSSELAVVSGSQSLPASSLAVGILGSRLDLFA